MKTMKNVFGLKVIASLMIAFVMIFASCSKTDEVAVSESTLNVNTESSEDSYHNDADDLANSISAQTDLAITGRSEGISDNRFCADTKITLKNRDKSNSDTLMIDFGAVGCTDTKNNIRKGKIIVVFETGKRLYPQFTNTVTFENFFVNGVKVEGIRTVKNISPNLDGDITFDIALIGGKLTFPDGTTATRTARHFRQWTRNGTPLVFSDDQQKILAFNGDIQSTAYGKNRKNYEYEMKIIKDIVYKNSCLIENKVFIPVSGTKVLKVTKDGKVTEITVDYGDGACDRKVTITINGKSETVEVKRDDNG